MNQEDGFYARPEGQVLCIYTIFEPPFEHPEDYVVRRFEVRGPKVRWTPLTRTARTLDAVRELLPPGLACIAKEETDHPQIVESWL